MEARKGVNEAHEGEDIEVRRRENALLTSERSLAWNPAMVACRRRGDDFPPRNPKGLYSNVGAAMVARMELATFLSNIGTTMATDRPSC